MNKSVQSRFAVEGMDCASCATKIDSAVRRMPGVSDVSVSVTAGTMTVTHDSGADLDVIGKTLSRLGYPSKTIAPKLKTAAVEAEADHVHGPACGHGDYDHHDHKGHHHAHNDHDCAGHSHENHHDHGSHDHDHDEKNMGLHGHDHGPSSGPWWKSAKGRLTILSGLSLVVAYGVGHLVPAIATYAFILAMRMARMKA